MYLMLIKPIFNLIKNTEKNSNIFKYYYNLKQYISILFKYNDGESSVSYDHSEIILIF